jgi:Domain of unknown function (DUF4347)/Cadherin-like/Right handed beta helix region/Cadherin domain/Periplasmic copper-binding protein (NosD)
MAKTRKPALSPSAQKVSAIAEALEPRVLFSADLAPLALSTSGSGSQVVEQARQTSSVAPVNATTSQLFVVDLRIADVNGLLAGLLQQQIEAQSRGEQFEILTLDVNDDGINRISQALAKQGNVSGLHLLGHGEDGRMLLGNSWIDENSLRSRAADYSQWSIGLSSDADVLLYGCDFAVSGSGKLSVLAIAQLTGADVAASTDATANASRAGNWVLEYQTGRIEATTQAVSSAAASVQWQGKLATFSVTNTADSGAGSLRDAINAANLSAGADIITFNIAGAGVHTIDLLSSLPDVTDSVVIDGTTQSGYTSAPIIELNGASAGSADGIKLSSGSNGSTVRGLIINRFNGAGIHILSNSNTIIGNYVGTNFDGTGSSANSFSGIFVNDSAGNLIGGATASERNVVSGNLDAGIYIYGSSGSGNTILGNYVGTNAAGSANLGNGSEGIVVVFGAYNLIGGFNAGEGNLVSGNTDNGISLYQSNHNIVRGNIVGMDAAGNAVIANGQSGISLNLANFETIGGGGLGEGNRVAGNLQSGVYFNDSNSITIQGNLIGGSSASIIIGNVGAGVVGAGTSSNALVGGVNASDANIIVGNNVGIAQTAGAGTNNAFLGNRVYSNTSIGIDLLWNGVTLNDAGADPDLGPNGLQNFPLLYAANSTAGVTLITGELNSNANTNYRIEFFSSPSGDATGYGEGPTYLGFTNVTTDAAGRASINASLSGVSVPFANSVTSTATVNLGAGTFGATSEFSQNVVSTVGTPGVTVTQPTVPITTESGGTASFSIVLNAAPSSNVTINLSSSDPTEGSIAISTLTFTPLNWNVAQTVTVTGVNDYLLDGAIGYSVITSTLISADVGFNGLSVADISLTTPDDDSYNTLIVDTVSDVFDGDTSSIAALYANRGADGKISLREAIFAAGNTPNPVGTVNHIHFDIQDPLIGGAHTISLTGALPTIVQAVVIDGSTEPDWAANGDRPVVVIEGNSLSATGLQFNGTSGGSTLRGLVIRNFAGTGILLMTGANGITIAGNYIGSLNTSGNYLGPGSANDFGGIYVDSSNNTIGGTGAFDRNVISGNLTSALALHSSNGNVVQNNFIGTDAAGTALIGNTGDGILLINGSASNQIGSVGFGNLIVGNNNGVSIHDAGSTNNKIQSNIIGTDLSLTLNLGNVQEGVEVLFGASYNLIGGVNAGEGNVIFNNGSTAWAAISIEDTSTGNAILGNRIDSSFGLGIQLGWGSTLPLPNDLGDGDTGANDQHNYPVLVSATVAGGNTTILGTMNSIANQPFRIEFFSSPVGDPTGYGEARNYLGFITGTTNASGNASFTAALSGVAVPVGFAVTATATVELGAGVYRSTSEFAQNVLVTGPLISSIAGRVLDDPEADGNVASSTGLVAQVYLFRDDGDGVMNAADTLVAIRTSSADGTYAFDGLAAGTYWTVVDSRSIQAAFNAGFDASATWWEQTYGSAGARTYNGSYNYSFSGGELLGGARRDVSDGFGGTAATLANAEHAIQTVIASAQFVTGVNFGFTSSAIVTTLDGDDDLSAARSKQGSLRQFIQNSSALAGGQVSSFRLVATDTNYSATTGVWRISIAQSLPTLDDGGNLAGYTQASWGGDTNPGSYSPPADPLRQFVATSIAKPEIEIVGVGAAAAGSVIYQAGFGGGISGLSFFGFNDGIVTAANGAIIEANFIGVNASGSDALLGHLSRGIVSISSASMILRNNLIAYTSYDGITVSSSTGLTITDNTITRTGLVNSVNDGINATGTTTGLSITKNSILFSNGYGIDLGVATAPLVSNNFIADSGLAGIERSGIYIRSGVQTAIIEANTITRSQYAIGIVGDGSLNPHQIGGINKGNIIVGNQAVGISLSNTNGVKIQGNKIGVTSSLVALPNVDSGIWAEQPSINTLVGGVNAGEGNVIANASISYGAGLELASYGLQTTILGNSIYNNAAIGISLGPDRNVPTPNDGNDADLTALTGPQNYPVLASVQAIGITTQISGSLNSKAGRVYRIEAFRNPAALVEANGFAEGAEFLGFFNVSTDALGFVSFNRNLAASTTSGDKITLIATEDFGSGYGPSSEFSLSATVSSAPPGVTVTPLAALVTSEAGTSTQFSLVLNTAPISNVTINFSVSDTSEGLLAFNSVIFTPLNWNVAQVVTVTGVDDRFVDGNVVYYINFAPAGSADAAYTGIGTSSLQFTNNDNDTYNTVVVNTTSDAADGDTSSIAALSANKGGDGRISLREAIIAANNTVNGVGGIDRISFDIADPLIGGAHIINVQSQLTGITDAVFIDGYSQPSTVQNSLANGTNAQLQIEVRGDLTFNANGLFLDSGSSGSTIQGLIITGFLGNGTPGGHGILVSSSNNSIQGNYIGVSNDGTIQSNWAGIVVNTSASGNLIGGSLPVQRNVVSGNLQGGISVLGVANINNSIQGNFIGLAPDGVTARANGNYGIIVWNGASAIRIGGAAIGEGNVIHANSGVGVQVGAGSTASILGNSISANGGLGIDLNSDGVTVNDVGDLDTGGNNLQNFPLIVSANSTGGNTNIRFNLGSNANSSYRVEFFSSPVADASGYGEALTYLGFTTVITDAAGFANANLTFTGVSVVSGHQITATATVDNGAGSYGPTSEFSKNVVVSLAPPGVMVSLPAVLMTTEAGGNAQFSVVLNSPPTADTIITLGLSDLSEATLSTTSLVFNASNWNIAQIVIVTGADDSYIDGNIAYSVVTSNVVSSDPAYNGLVVTDIALTNIDNDTFNTLVVDTTADTIGGDTSSIAALYANKGADGKISLREAILAANNTANGSQRDSILFNIADPLIGGAHTINVLSALPTITDAVLLDGSSEPDFGLAHVVELRGDGAGLLTAGLVVTASNSQINGLTINRFNGNGLSILGNNNVLTNNYIGLSSSGLSSMGLGNGVHGIYLFNASNSTIGGATAGLGNAISGNGQNGIEIRDSSSTVVQNNLVGISADGSTTVANGSSGVYVVGAGSAFTLIGGSSAAGNTIGGNTLSGVALDDTVSGATISSNFIGTNSAGAINLGNAGAGIYSDATNVDISSNLIAYNKYGAVEIRGSESIVQFNNLRFGSKGVVVAASATGVTITNNVMDNVGLLIDLGNDGFSANDAGDIDTGPNDFLNTAMINSVSSDGVGQIRVAGSFNGQANRTLTVDVYEHGIVGVTQRSRFVGSFTMSTDAAGNASFNQTLSGAFSTGSLFSSTVTDTTTALNRSTSEHSNAVAAGAPGVVVTPTSALIVNESGTSTTVSISLSTAPTADVTINFSVSVLGEVNLSTISVTFTAANWNVPQLLTITGLQDFVADGDQVVTIVTSAAVSADPSYSGLSVADITVTSQAIPNVAPVINAPASYNVTEDTPVTFSSGISLSDADAGNNPLDVTITVSNGVFSLGTVVGLSFFAGDGTADASMTFSGTVAQINAAIDSLTFTPTANFAGTTGLSLFVNDLGNTGSGGAQGVSQSIPIIVAPVNDAATFSGTKTGALNEGAVLKITSTMLRLVDIDNPSSDLVFTVITQKADGELQLSGTTLRVGDSFTQADIDNGLIDYVHFSGENPTASITLGLTERFGGSLPDVTLNLTVAPVNDAPVITGLVGGTIVEITTVGAVVGTATVTDADNAAGTVFSLSNDDNASFAIDAVTGVITVLNPLQLDYETAPQHTIRVKVTDASGTSTERNFIIELVDVPEFVPTGETPTTAPPTGIVPPVLVAPTTASTVTLTPVNSSTNALGSDLAPGINPVNQTVNADDSRASGAAKGNGNGKARQLDKENEVWVDNSQEVKALALKDAKRRFVGAIDLELLDAAGNVRQRRSLNSDALDLLFRSRKNAGTFTTPPMVLLGEFKLPASAQSGVVDEGSMVPSATQSRMNVVIDSIEVGGVVMSVGVVAWVARTGGLLAALISAMPAWKGLDPLLVLSPSKSNKMKAAEDFEEFSDTDLREDEEAVQAVLF